MRPASGVFQSVGFATINTGQAAPAAPDWKVSKAFIASRLYVAVNHHLRKAHERELTGTLRAGLGCI
jgi:hypothetical protein